MLIQDLLKCVSIFNYKTSTHVTGAVDIFYALTHSHGMVLQVTIGQLEVRLSAPPDVQSKH